MIYVYKKSDGSKLSEHPDGYKVNVMLDVEVNNNTKPDKQWFIEANEFPPIGCIFDGGIYRQKTTEQKIEDDELSEQEFAELKDGKIAFVKSYADAHSNKLIQKWYTEVTELSFYKKEVQARDYIAGTKTKTQCDLIYNELKALNQSTSVADDVMLARCNSIISNADAFTLFTAKITGVVSRYIGLINNSTVSTILTIDLNAYKAEIDAIVLQ